MWSPSTLDPDPGDVPAELRCHRTGEALVVDDPSGVDGAPRSRPDRCTLEGKDHPELEAGRPGPGHVRIALDDATGSPPSMPTRVSGAHTCTRYRGVAPKPASAVLTGSRPRSATFSSGQSFQLVPPGGGLSREDIGNLLGHRVAPLRARHVAGQLAPLHLPLARTTSSPGPERAARIRSFGSCQRRSTCSGRRTAPEVPQTLRVPRRRCPRRPARTW